MSPIVDLGTDFDGRCAVCREWINPGTNYRVLAAPPTGAPHAVVHANAQGDGVPCASSLRQRCVTAA